MGRDHATIGGLWLVAAGLAGWRLQAAWAWQPAQVADALPLYLSARALRAGLDPTSAADLAVAYHQLDLHVQAEIFSTLYPASAGVLLLPLSAAGWGGFVVSLRLLVWAGFLLGAALTGHAATAGRPIGAPLGVILAILAVPMLTTALGLAQLNLLIAGLFGVALWGLVRARPGAVGAALAVGAGAKLVPAMGLWVLLTGHRWRALAVFAVLGGLLAGATLIFVPLPALVAALLETARFQSTVLPAWTSVYETRAWVHLLGLLRHGPLGLSVLGLTGLCAWQVRALPPTPRGSVLAGALALGATWLAADGAAVGVFYATIAAPALVWLALWPLSPGAPRWSPLAAALALAPIVAVALPALSVEPRLMVALWLTGLGVTLRLLHDAPPLPRKAVFVLLLVSASLVAMATRRALFPPPGSAPDAPAAPPTFGEPSAPQQPRL